MDTISFSCPKCNIPMTAETIYCGHMVRCPQCGIELEIPQNKELTTTQTCQSNSPTHPNNHNSNSNEKIPSAQNKPSNYPNKLQVQSTNIPFANCVEKLYLSAKIIWGGIVIILLLSLVVINKKSQGPFEYKVEYFNTHYSYSFTEKINKLAKEGYEYVGPLTNGNILFRKEKNAKSENYENIFQVK